MIFEIDPGLWLRTVVLVLSEAVLVIAVGARLRARTRLRRKRP